ncbi:Signal transduction histidine-protein kinase BarA [Photobacterium damselae subsp. damselae]|uniref:two-component sensor histidine kinase BarA n=1 Tax=Photobacterium damselae TaxID=38293 RepID=UPI00084B58B4|nr:two-component sensor histidine kinase BarA [Photobacterium damselae]OEC82611.1 two-component sensor histidine kinase BarA [Photobacterium damselae subsp. damselae]PSB81008.1 two-component sensor histidine kinase BarA [Photobacterium damselae subsp. damselae]TGZ33679.1 Signal transduction histidine-protein kinase BarA [Photobacterium damselae subsp. damselae]
MTRYGLRARVFTLTLAPTLIIGLLLSAFFTLSRYQDLEHQLISTGTSIIEPLAISAEYGMTDKNREAVRRLISYAHRKHSNIVRSIAVFDAHNQLFVTSNFHRNFEALMYPPDKPIPPLLETELRDNALIMRAPILTEGQFGPHADPSLRGTPLGYISLELDLSALRLQQYQEVFTALMVLLLGLTLSSLFAYRLMQDVTRPISHMVSVVDRIRRGHLDIRIEGRLLGELDTLKNGINAMAISLSEYHVEMQQSIDQATSDLRETLEQLEIQNVELDIAKKRAQEAARVKSEFLANMSHELRTPLNGVLGFTRQMLKTRLNPSQQDYLLTIEKSANNLLTIINDILDFSKLEAGKLLLENIPFDFAESLDEVMRLLAPTAHEKGLELTLKVDDRIPPSLIGDALRIQQVLTNLIGNAVKFTERGNIDVTVELKSDKDDEGIELQFMVRDTGIGISERQQAQLFQAFSQADASISRRYGGTGLGLVITQKLVSQMGGEVSLTSRLHQGSTFWFTVRLTKTDLPVSQLIDTSSLSGKKVLLIEPNMQAASVIQQRLINVGVHVTYRSVMPEDVERHDYTLLCLSPGEQPPIATLIDQVFKAEQMTDNVIVCLPTTELALSERLVNAGVSACLGKPLSQRRLFEVMCGDNEQMEPEQPLLPEPASPIQPLTVMAVDDNPANLKLISALLCERVETVITATGGRKAVEYAKQKAFDLIFMDIQMPEMDGVTACQQIHDTELNRTTPVIAVTAHAMAGERERLINAGMDDYLTKPIEEHILQQVLGRWIAPIESQIEPQTLIAPLPTSVESVPKQDISFDWDLALKQAAGKEDLARDMIQMLLDFMPEVEMLVNEALDGKEVDLWPPIHKLHGSCAYSGVPRLKNLCHTIETALKGNASNEDIEPELFELVDEMENVVRASKAYRT